jgi:aerobic carbon-monoxide dehydrogenase small subunit
MSGELAVALTVNGMARSLNVPASMTLLEMVRSRLGLTGSKECCAEGECGACTMILDGEPVNSCLILAVETDGAAVTTIEGIGKGEMTPLQESFLAEGAVQCGFCIPGMVVAATALLDRVPQPSVGDVHEALSGNLCRCGGYSRIANAVMRVVAPGVLDD